MAIKFDVLQTGNKYRDENFDVFYDDQELTSGNSKETLDDIVDKIDATTVRQEDGGYAFHVRTKPIKKRRLWQKALHWLKPDLGILRYIGNAIAGKSIQSYFGIDPEGARTRVIETSTPEGVILDIFYNVGRMSMIENLAESYYKPPFEEGKKDVPIVKLGKFLVDLGYATIFGPKLQKNASGYSRSNTTPEKGDENADKGRKRREFAKVLEKLGEVYEKLGIREGKVVLSPDMNIGTLADRNIEIRENDSSKNCTFYDVFRVETEDVGSRDSPYERRKPRVHKPGRKSSPSKSSNPPKESGVADTGDITFNDVIGLEEQVKKFRSAIKYFKDPEEYRKNRGGLGLEAGCILYGPEGTGKTHLAKAFANEAGVPLIVYKGSDLFNMYVGESEKAIADMFADARKLGKCVILVDEIDQIASSRKLSDSHPVARRVVNMLLTELQGFEERGDVYLLGTTNLMENIDSAFKRRVGKIKIDLPAYEARKAMVKKTVEDHAKKAEDSPYGSPFTNLDYDAIAQASEGFSGSDLIFEGESVFRDLCNKYYDACDNGKNPAKLTTQDWINQIKENRVKYEKEKEEKMGFHKGE